MSVKETNIEYLCVFDEVTKCKVRKRIAEEAVSSRVASNVINQALSQALSPSEEGSLDGVKLRESWLDGVQQAVDMTNILNLSNFCIACNLRSLTVKVLLEKKTWR